MTSVKGNDGLPVVLVDDDEALLESVRLLLRSSGVSPVTTFTDGKQALAGLRRHGAEMLIMDLEMPTMSGQELLGECAREFPEIPVVVMTGNQAIDTAVECMRMGAFDYVTKPVDEQRLLVATRRALEYRRLDRENRRLRAGLLRQELQHPEAFSAIVTADERMHAIFRYVECVAVSDQPVLITGETGVGKELLARAAHAASGRAGACVAVNMAGLDDTLFADTLFGHCRGAYTGAERERQGLVEQARGGTIFLDEIGDLGLASQAKLLRLLQEGEYFRLGEDRPRRAQVKVVAATLQDLAALQEQGRFRRDLFYRLQTHHLHIPPLRERLHDLPLLVEHCVHAAAAALNKKPPAYPDELITLLQVYDFPGNVRELQALIHDAVSTHTSGIMSLEPVRRRISGREPTPNTSRPAKAPPLAIPGRFPTIKQATLYLVRESLRRSDGNQSVAAGLLGISRQALNKRVKAMGESHGAEADQAGQA